MAWAGITNYDCLILYYLFSTMTATMNSIAKKMVLISIVKFTVQLISVTSICVLEILIASTLDSLHALRTDTR